MRFLHTADWQIGMAAAHTGSAAARVQAARLDTAQKLIDLCRTKNVDFLLLAGDTFQHNAVDRVLVTQVARLLGDAPCPVHVIPGNHDCLEPGSVWDLSVWSSYSQVCVHRERKPFPVEGGTLFPCPLFHRRKEEDPTAWISDLTPKGGIRVALAHGHVPIPSMDADTSYNIPVDAADRGGLDYLALGHWHSASINLHPRMAYSGTHEATKFGERDSGTALLVNIASPGILPVVEVLRTGKLNWVCSEKVIATEGDLTAVFAWLEQLPDPAATLLRLTLSGHLFPAETAILDWLHQRSSAFLCLDIDHSALLPAPHDHSWADSLPPGVIRETALRLIQQNTPEARQALLHLNVIAREVARA